MRKRKDYTGNVYNGTKVLEFSHVNKYNVSHWHVECQCGNTFIERSSNITNGKLNNCRCKYRHKQVRHGKSGHRLNKVWREMRYRCLNETDSAYPNYGGRGITVCDEWETDFEAFYKWAMENGHENNLTLDRIDNDGGYSPSNCRWATAEEQAKNRRSNRWITYKGQTKCLSDWAKEIDMEKNTLTRRLNKGWSIEKAFETPVKKYNK